MFYLESLSFIKMPFPLTRVRLVDTYLRVLNMPLKQSKNMVLLKEAGWHLEGYCVVIHGVGTAMTRFHKDRIHAH